MKRNYFMAGFFIIALVSSCKSLPSFKGEGDLCGLIVDENNSPVKDFVIYCKNELDTRTALTDENGMFVVHGVPSGVYKISGQKKNYVKLENAEFLFIEIKSFAIRWHLLKVHLRVLKNLSFVVNRKMLRIFWISFITTGGHLRKLLSLLIDFS